MRHRVLRVLPEDRSCESEYMVKVACSVSKPKPKSEKKSVHKGGGTLPTGLAGLEGRFDVRATQRYLRSKIESQIAISTRQDSQDSTVHNGNDHPEPVRHKKGGGRNTVGFGMELA
jgi:hypothetical protein